MVVLPSRKEKDEPNALLHNQAGLPVHQGEAKQCLCRTHTDCAVLSTEDSSADNMPLPRHEGWGCSRVASVYGSTDMPSTAGGNTAITSLRMGKITHTVNWARRVPARVSQKGRIWFTPTKTYFLFFARKRLVFKQLCKHNGGFTRETEVNKTFASAF